jgi:hypothetical protein
VTHRVEVLAQKLELVEELGAADVESVLTVLELSTALGTGTSTCTVTVTATSRETTTQIGISTF